MSIYVCNGCAILCKCEIPDECDFKPMVCLAQIEKAHYEPNWEREEEEQ